MIHLLNQTLFYFTEYTVNMYGDKEASFEKSCECRFVQNTKVIFGTNGNQLNINGKIQIPPLTPKLKEGMVVECEGQKYEIEMVKDWKGGGGKLFGQLLYVREYLDPTE